MDEIFNLWNANKKIKKTRDVYDFIDNLDTPYKSDPDFNEKKFWGIIDNAKTQPTANAMLQTIGYINHKRKPKIFDWCSK